MLRATRFFKRMMNATLRLFRIRSPETAENQLREMGNYSPLLDSESMSHQMSVEKEVLEEFKRLLDEVAVKSGRKIPPRSFVAPVGPDSGPLYLESLEDFPDFAADGQRITPQLARLMSRYLSGMLKSMEVFLLDAAKAGDADSVHELLEGGVSPNFQDPVSGATALHFAAAIEAFSVVEVLLQAKDIDLLLKDEEGQLASARAWEVAENSDLGTMLMEREIKQAQSQGIDYRDVLTGRPRE